MVPTSPTPDQSEQRAQLKGDDDLVARLMAQVAHQSAYIEQQEANLAAMRDFISELQGEGAEDLPGDTRVVVTIGDRCKRFRRLSDLRALSQAT